MLKITKKSCRTSDFNSVCYKLIIVSAFFLIAGTAGAQSLKLPDVIKEKAFPVTQIEQDGKVITVVLQQDTVAFYDMNNYKIEHSSKFIPENQKKNVIVVTEQGARVIPRTRNNPQINKEKDNK